MATRLASAQQWNRVAWPVLALAATTLLDEAIGAGEVSSVAAGVGTWSELGVCDCAAVANATASIPAKRFISPT